MDQSDHSNRPGAAKFNTTLEQYSLGETLDESVQARALEAAPVKGLFTVGEEVNGRYRIEAVIGQGGMGVVYRVSDALFPDRALAMKTVRGIDIFADSHHLLRAEFQIMTGLRHPNLAAVYDFEPIQGTGDSLFTMDFVDGTDIFRATRGVSLQEVIEILVQVCRALSYIHSRRLIHLDLKPPNLMIDRDGLVKVLDFGIAEIKSSMRAPQMRGTPWYMAPELTRGGVLVDHRADLYSLGIVAYELLCRRLPFDANTVRELLRMHHLDPVVFDENTAVPPWLRDMIVRLCAKDPADRYQTANAVIEALNSGGEASYEVETEETRESYIFSSRFVGRRRELQRAMDFAQACLEGKRPRGGAMFVVGQSGVGKSRFIRELRYRVQLSESFFVEGHCYEGTLDEYAPIAEVLGHIVRLAISHKCLAPFEHHGLYLARIYPAVTDVYKIEAASHEDSPEVERQRLLEHVSGFLLEVAERISFVLCFDDLQWARQGTIDLIVHLLKKLSSRTDKEARVGLGLFGCYRDDEVKGRPLGSLVAHLKALGQLELLTLFPLGTTQVKTLIGSMLGISTLPTAFLQRITAETGGNPFFVEEVMRALVESGAVYIKGGQWATHEDIGELEIPTGMAAAFRRRVSFLTEAAQLLLEVLAITDRPVAPEVLEIATGQSRESFYSALADLVHKQMASRIPGEIALYRLRHDGIRQTLYASLEEGRRRALHALVADALKTVHRDNLAPFAYALANHYWLAGRESEALTWCLEGAEQARTAYAHDMAIELYEHARDILVAHDPESPQLGTLVEMLGDCYAIRGKHAEAMAVYEDAAARVKDTLARARLQWKTGGLFLGRDELEKAIEQTWAAVELFGDSRPRTWLGALWGIFLALLTHVWHRLFPTAIRMVASGRARERLAGLVASYVNLSNASYYSRPLNGILTALRACNRADRLGVARETCEAYGVMAIFYSIVFPFSTTLRYGYRALDMAGQLDSTWHRGDANRALGAACSGSARLKESERFLERGAALYCACGDLFWHAVCRVLLFSSQYKLGKLERAAESLEHGLSLLKTAGGKRRFERSFIPLLAWLSAKRGKLEIEEAIRQIREALVSHEEEDDDPLFGTLCAFALGEILLIAGEHEQAIKVLSRGLRYRRSAAQFEWVAPIHLQLAHAYLEDIRSRRREGKKVPSSLWWRAFRLVYSGLGITRFRHPSSRPMAFKNAAVYQWMKGRRRRAAQLFQRSREASESLGTRFWSGDAYFEEGICQLEEGGEHVAAGLECLSKAQAIFRECGAALLAERAATLSQQLSKSGP